VAKDHSFDVVSEVNWQEVDNAVSQAKKELDQRFDFKGSMSSIDFDKTEKQIVLKCENEYKLKALVDMVQTKFVKRGVSLKALDFQKIESGMVGGSIKQVVKVKSGIESDKAREIVKGVKDLKMKVQASIEGDQIRVKGAQLDDLQAVIQKMRAQDFGVELQFVNFR